MIKAVKKEEVTLDNILSKVTQYDIFRYYIGHDFDYRVPFSSPFRDDRTPSFSVMKMHNGGLFFSDFADDTSRGNITDFLVRVFPGKDYNQILHQVQKDLNVSPVSTGKRIQFKEGKDRELSTFIVVTPRPFDTYDLNYWKSYHQTYNDLKANNVYAVKEFKVNGVKVKVPSTELVFGYHFSGTWWKIYRPLAENKEDKWTNSTPNLLMYGLQNVMNCENAIVTKSFKDYLVLKKLCPNVCGVQSEGTTVISNENLLLLKSNCRNVFINFDNDIPGKKASRYYTKEHGFKHVNVPDSYLEKGIKDFADLAKVEGLETVRNYLISKNIIT